MKTLYLVFSLLLFSGCQTIAPVPETIPELKPIPLNITKVIDSSSDAMVQDYISNNEPDVTFKYAAKKLSINSDEFNAILSEARNKNESFLAIVEATSSVESFADRRVKFLTDKLLSMQVAVIISPKRLANQRKGSIWLIPLNKEPEWRTAVDYLIIEPR